ncbi:MAG: ABC transporter permease [Phycisphaerales bacterium]|jgi:galactofuranose transport system permease protein|nr:ABC transporter permease [Phycisphaerales bacterium]
MPDSDTPAKLLASANMQHATGGMSFVKAHSMPFFFLALIVLNSIFTPSFLSIDTLDNTLRQAFPMMLVALGMTMVISSGGIDISVGAIMAVSAAVTARIFALSVLATTPVSVLLILWMACAICCGLLAAGVCGLLNGMLISKFKIQPIIVTLIVMFVARSVAQMILGELPLSLMGTRFEDLGRLRILGAPIQVLIMIGAVAAMLFIAKKTVFARRVEAIGENRRAARLVGINIFRVTVGVYVLCAVLCAIAGVMEAARGGRVDAGRLGMFIELDAIAAVAIGGTAFSGGRARILGTVFGAVLVQLVTVIVNMNDISYHYSLILKAVVLVTAVWAQKDK